MTVRIRHIIQWIDSLAPFRFAESWDNCGLQVGRPEAQVTRVLVALDPGAAVLSEASELGCQCIVTHHPLLLRPINAVRTDSWPGSIIEKSLVHGINIIAAHTNLDAASEGTNTQLARLLSLNYLEPLESQAGFEREEKYLGIGLIGTLPAELSLERLAQDLEQKLGGANIRTTGDLQKSIARVAICTGSGASLINKVQASGVHAYITGDMKYHDGRLAEEIGLCVIDIGHFASEKLVLEPLASFLRFKAKMEGAEIEVSVSRSEKDPFQLTSGKC